MTMASPAFVASCGKEDDSGAGPAVNEDGFFASVDQLFEKDDVESAEQLGRRTSAHSVVVAVKRKRSSETVKIMKRSDVDLTCDICATEAKDCMLSCGHLLCRTCDETWRETGHASCPFCRASTTADNSAGKDGHVSLELRLELPRRLALKQRFAAAKGPVDRHLLRKSIERESDQHLLLASGQLGQLILDTDDEEEEEDLTEEIDLSVAHRVGEDTLTTKNKPATKSDVIDCKVQVSSKTSTVVKPQKQLQANVPKLTALYPQPQDNQYELLSSATPNILP